MHVLGFCLAFCPQASGQSPVAPGLTVAPAQLNFQVDQCGDAPPPQPIQIGGTQGLAWTATVATTTGGSWFTVSPGSGQTLALAWVQVTGGAFGCFAYGTYKGSITIQAPGATPPTVTVNVSLTQTAPLYALTASPSALYFSVPEGSPSQSQSVGMSGGFTWTATAATSTGGAWLSASSGVFLTATVNAAGLPPGTYEGSITVQAPDAAPTSIAVPVGLTVTVPLFPRSTNACRTARTRAPDTVESPLAGEWMWLNGSNLANPLGTGPPGVYGTRGIPAPSNVPGARHWAASWTDAAGNFWLFGGMGLDSTGTYGYLNDLWKYSAGEWTWMGGGNLASDFLNGVSYPTNHPGTYGTQGTPSQSNIPGPRAGAAIWTDASGDVWIFGGQGPDPAGACCSLADLWKYGAGEWTWMGGPNVANTPGMYGIPGMPGAFNVPGGRTMSVAWTDAAGNQWLLGGLGRDSAGSLGLLGDLWEYSSGGWIWIGGYNVVNGGVAPGIPNYPAPRYGSAGWADPCGPFRLLGGWGDPTIGNDYTLTDLMLSYDAGQWRYIAGSGRMFATGDYGTLGTAAPGNEPGGRSFPVTWTDAAGDLWLFGGYGYDSKDNVAEFADFWKYSLGEWAWMGGSKVANQRGVYGTQGTAAASNTPGGRGGAASWTDSAGNLWLFGGYGIDSAGNLGILGDLWKYSPVSNGKRPR